jgi:Terminase large subunit, T4likevirus-type, N-terminal
MPPFPPPTWRLEKEALFADLGYCPHAGQLRVHRSKARHRVLACGARWGKSTAAAMEAVAELLLPRESGLGWLVAPTYDLTRRIHDRVVMLIQERLVHRIQNYRPREHTISVTNLGGGISVLTAKSADQPVSLLGEGLDFLIVDEAAQLADYVWEDHLSPRLLDRKGSSLCLSTPQGGGWFYEAFKRGQKGRDPEYESWRAPSWENPHLDRAVIEAERGRLPAEKFAQQYEAEFLGVPGEPCETCGGPRPENPEMITMPEGKDEKDLSTCPRCGMYVDESGRCIVHYSNKWFACLDIDMPWGDCPEMIMCSWTSPDADGRWS